MDAFLIQIALKRLLLFVISSQLCFRLCH